MKTFAIIFNFVFGVILIALWVVVAPVYPILAINDTIGWHEDIMGHLYRNLYFETRCWWHNVVDFATMPWQEPIFFKKTLAK